jgi:hypothetical protein
MKSVGKKIVKALARPGGPAAMLPTVKGLAAKAIKKGVRYGAKKVHHAIRSGALLKTAGDAKAHVERGMSEMRGGPIKDKKLRFASGERPMIKRPPVSLPQHFKK